MQYSGIVTGNWPTLESARLCMEKRCEFLQLEAFFLFAKREWILGEYVFRCPEGKSFSSSRHMNFNMT